MQNDMRDRLVDLIKECHKKENDIMFGENKSLEFDEWTGIYADHLIANGVVLPPCRVGDSCYPLPRYKAPIVERKISRITFSKRNIIIGYYENDGQYRPPLRTRVLGEDVFLTKDQAEQKLKELRENG